MIGSQQLSPTVSTSRPVRETVTVRVCPIHSPVKAASEGADGVGVGVLLGVVGRAARVLVTVTVTVLVACPAAAWCLALAGAAAAAAVDVTGPAAVSVAALPHAAVAALSSAMKGSRRRGVVSCEGP